MRRLSENRTPIPVGLQRTLQRSFDNVEQLEILLTLQRNPSQYWDAGAVAERVGLIDRAAAVSLESLARKGFLDVRVGETLKYRFSPSNVEQNAMLQAVAELWRSNRPAVTEAIASRRRALRDFSDAFRLGKGDDDG